jgi:serine/threonine protein kinase
MMLARGHVLHNRYHILEVLGQGGMATVYKAHDAIRNCSCAVKEMIPDPTASPQALAAALDQFRREAQVLATLRHPGLPQVIDHFEERGHAYLVMDFIEGESLAERLEKMKGKPLPEHLVRAWAQQLLEALEHCHRHNVIHRDIKPHNAIVTPTGRIVLVDFGLVKLYDPTRPGTATVVRGMGTPEYTPPEQYDAPGAGHTDARSDIYALGAKLYHLVTGEAPPTVTQRMADPHSFRRPRQLNANVSPQMESVILKAMEIPRDRRFRSAAEMWAALAGWTEKPQTPPEAIPSRKAGFPVWAWALGGLTIVMLMVVVRLMTGEAIPSSTPHLTRAPAATAMVTPMPKPTAKPSAMATPTPKPTATPMREVIYSNDFQEIVGSEWSSHLTDITQNGRRFLGQFGNDTVSLTLGDLPAHTDVTVSFDLFIIRSWDGNRLPGPGPDVWDLSVAGGQTLLHTTFANADPSNIRRQAYPGTYPGGEYPGRTGAAEIDTLEFTRQGTPAGNSVYRLSFTFPHSTPSLVLNFSASGLQDLLDESWGIDNVEVQVTQKPYRENV